jgi:hypothetical protein
MGCTSSNLSTGEPAIDFGATKLVFVLGGPGSGKGTLCERFVAQKAAWCRSVRRPPLRPSFSF